MKMKPNLSFGLLFVLMGLSVQAQKYDLAACLRMAETANVQIRNAQLDVAINESQRSAYLSTRLPSLNFSGDYRYNAVIPGQVVPAQFFWRPSGYLRRSEVWCSYRFEQYSSTQSDSL